MLEYILTLIALIIFSITALLMLEYIPPLLYMHKKRKQRDKQGDSEIDITRVLSKITDRINR